MKNRTENFFGKIRDFLNFLNYFLKIFLIIIVLFLILEMFSFFAIKIFHGVNYERVDSGVYNGKPWAEQFFKEFQDSFNLEYAPYLAHRRSPNYIGETINLNEKSIRKTTECNLENPKKIFIFGGSTIWGDGSRDDFTIPSIISKILCNGGIPVEVTNFGESAYTNTQGMIRLQLELQKGNIPDVVVFYDGINDVVAAYQSEAGMPHNLADRERDYGARNELNIGNILLESNFVRLMNGILRRTLDNGQIKINLDEKSSNIVSVYGQNIIILRALEKEFGFKTFFYWQPSLYSKSVKSNDELEVLDVFSNFDGLGNLFVGTTSKVERIERVNDLSEAFNGFGDTIYIDLWHVSEDGNKVIGDIISKDIEMFLNKGG